MTFEDDTEPAGLLTARQLLVGQRIIAVEKPEPDTTDNSPIGTLASGPVTINIGSGQRVLLHDTIDCAVESVNTNINNAVEEVTGVYSTEDGTKWHVCNNLGDIITLNVGWNASFADYQKQGLVAELQYLRDAPEDYYPEGEHNDPS